MVREPGLALVEQQPVQKGDERVLVGLQLLAAGCRGLDVEPAAPEQLASEAHGVGELVPLGVSHQLGERVGALPRGVNGQRYRDPAQTAVLVLAAGAAGAGGVSAERRGHPTRSSKWLIRCFRQEESYLPDAPHSTTPATV
jgi:hypothetical protein